MTNFEEIKSMNADEFISWFRDNDLCHYIRQKDFKWCRGRANCEGCHKEWLDKEVE